ncbi:MAG: hypothetical protein LBK95_18215 [Bifidobacteriaceae bacterium]|jgi:hypothetical protein|nr:hypothetical protein [Bifidobacteriaceae bacterium]
MGRKDLAERRGAVERMGLTAGERVLATGQTQAGGWLLATTARLGVVDEVGGVIVGEWCEINHAKLGSGEILTVTWGDERETIVARLTGGSRRLAAVVNERVTRSVVATRRVETDGGAVRVAIRRASDGGLFSQVIAPPGVDADVAELREAERDLREAVGLDG